MQVAKFAWLLNYIKKLILTLCEKIEKILKTALKTADSDGDEATFYQVRVKTKTLKGRVWVKNKTFGFWRCQDIEMETFPFSRPLIHHPPC